MCGVVSEETRTRVSTPSPRDLLQVLMRRLWAILLVVTILAGSALGFSLIQTPSYEASTKILIGQKATADTPRSLSGEIQGLQEAAPTMARAVTTRPVAQAVVEQLGLPGVGTEALLKNLSAQQEPGTTFIDILYKDSDPQRAQLIANTTGQVFSEQVSKVSPGNSAITATVWEPAVLPKSPVSPNPARNSLLALAFGILLGVGVAFLLEYLDDRWDSPEEAERISGFKTLATIPKFEVVAVKEGNGSVFRSLGRKQVPKEGDPVGTFAGLMTMLDPTSSASEAYKRLRTSLLYAVVDGPLKVILITSPGSAEGKSTTCANLAVVLAQAGKQTLLIDGDLRKPDVHKIFEMPNNVGLANVLSGERNLSEVLLEPLAGLKVVPVGSAPLNPAELLSSARFAEVIEQARQQFDYVLINSSSTESASDPMIIATQADAVLLVLDSQGTSKASLHNATHNLKTVGANILGTVLNNVEGTGDGSKYYG